MIVGFCGAGVGGNIGTVLLDGGVIGAGRRLTCGGGFVCLTCGVFVCALLANGTAIAIEKVSTALAGANKNDVVRMSISIAFGRPPGCPAAIMASHYLAAAFLLL